VRSVCEGVDAQEASSPELWAFSGWLNGSMSLSSCQLFTYYWHSLVMHTTMLRTRQHTATAPTSRDVSLRHLAPCLYSTLLAVRETFARLLRPALDAGVDGAPVACSS